MSNLYLCLILILMLVLMLILILILEKQPCLACVALAFKTLKSYMNMAMPMKRYVLLGRAVGRGSTGPVSARFPGWFPFRSFSPL